MSILDVKKLNRSFGGLHAVNDVSFSVESRQIKAVIGPNGAGKTTLFNLIAGALRADSGEVYFNENDISNFPSHRVASHGIARTFQNIKLYSHMSVIENVMMGRHVRSSAGFFAGLCNLPRTWKEEKRIYEKSWELIEMLGIAELAHHDATSLAFGQQRTVEFARALAMEPELLLLDEPAAGLNIYETAEIAEMIRKIRETGITILIIEHDMSLVMDISDEITVLSSGKKIAQGKPEEIQRNEEVIKIYLGEEDA